MKQGEITDTINRVRQTLFDATDALAATHSFAMLQRTSAELERGFEAIARLREHPHLRAPCDGHITCAIIGSSGHGKTTILDEMFPALSRRGWLETDVTDTTSQSLRIRYGAPGSPELDEVLVESWSSEQIKELMRHPDVVEQNERDAIRVTYLEDGVVVDGSQTTIDAGDRADWRFPAKLELQPLPHAYAVPAERARDRAFIRALTVKEPSAVLKAGPVIRMDGAGWDSLQLRAVVKQVSLRDDFEQIAAWADRPLDEVRRLAFVDTPGLATGSVAKDEVLRHFLGKKSNQIALQMLKNDDLDLVVHLVLCGQKSQFDALWGAIEREWGRAEMDRIAERLILAINGMNIYFTNPDLRAKYEDPATTQREGDHFAATLEDNILQRMSLRGQIRPARICFLDSATIVGAWGDYAQSYARFRKVMEQWAEPGGTGHDTLARLGIVESFRDNIDALADPSDRGQGYLVRQILELADEKGPLLLLRKYVERTGLLAGLGDLLQLLQRFYDREGRMNTAAAREAIGKCLAFLDPDDLGQLEAFAAREIDPHVPGLLPRERGTAGDWVPETFARLCDLVKESILDTADGSVPPEVWAEFARHFDAQVSAWTERWGYRNADFPPPHDAPRATNDLLVHCLRTHGREILYQLVRGERAEPLRGLEQSREDQDRIRDVLRQLEEAHQLAATACQKHGVLR